MRSAALFFFLLLSFCKPVSFWPQKSGEEYTNVAEVRNNVTAVTAAEVNISKERAYLSTTWIIKLFSPRDLEAKKKEMIADLCKKEKADIIIDPQFTIKKKILGGSTLTLSGYLARYVNFRNLTPIEVDSLIIHNKYRDGSVVFFNQGFLPPLE